MALTTLCAALVVGFRQLPWLLDGPLLREDATALEVGAVIFLVLVAPLVYAAALTVGFYRMRLDTPQRDRLGRVLVLALPAVQVALFLVFWLAALTGGWLGIWAWLPPDFMIAVMIAAWAGPPLILPLLVTARRTGGLFLAECVPWIWWALAALTDRLVDVPAA